MSDPTKPDEAPEPIADAKSAPISSGRVIATPADIKSGPVRAAISAAVSGGVEVLGASIGAVGEGVSKLGDVAKKLPLVGSNIGKLGEAVTRAGESIGALPTMAKTRRGAILVRSVVVGFVLIAAWIAAIVAVQVHADETVDFRPGAEKILAQLSRGSAAIEQVYEHASPRFQEMVREERFVDDMTDLAATVGTFREVTAINDTLVTSGPGGRVGRVSITAAYANGVCRGSISFHLDQGVWKLLGVGLELPPDLKITQKQREQRVAACKDNGNRRTCDVRDRAETILEQLRAGNAGDVWTDATPVFQQQESRDRFIELQQEYAIVLGSYKRVLRVTEARTGIGGTSATFDCVVEFERASGVRTIFGFERAAKTTPWQLTSFKLVVPMPRVDDATPATR
ncbi:MAG TPA: hypothetical protein VH143_15310 [Kofleriaceae bacterium]|jgi:hypothetical protein|nr:hypothetical protein [Kofleriaceae bacterium]